MSQRVLTVCVPVTVRVVMPDEAPCLPDDIERCAYARRDEIQHALDATSQVKKRRPYVGAPRYTLQAQARFVVRRDARQEDLAKHRAKRAGEA